ncbi:MAG: RNA-binding region RNP-1 [bacterium]|nr:MAG: RNA-binding region RNP-1 [bacterium]
MTAKLYIGNIAYNACGEDLSTLFAEAGTVVASRVIIDRITGKSRGFGFVEMGSQSEAESAISKFNGYSLLGRTLLVYLAHDNRELSRRAREAKQNQQQLTPSSSILEPKHSFYNQPIRNETLNNGQRAMRAPGRFGN